MKRLTCLFAFGVLLGGNLVAAQVRPNAPQAKRPAISVPDAVDVFYMKKIQPQVELTDDQYAKIVPGMTKWLATRRDITARRQRLLNQLRRATGPQGKLELSDEEIARITREYDQTEADRLANEQQFMKIADSVLTDRQRARLRVFQDTMERQILQYINSLTPPPAQGPPAAPPNTVQKNPS